MEHGALSVRLDSGAKVEVDLKSYNQFDYGYATTVHKSQGVTVDRVQVLASTHMDRHAAYVALSRHRHGVELHYGRDEFAKREDLVRALGRDLPKDMALDHMRPLGERDRVQGPGATIPPPRFKTPTLEQGAETYAKAFAEIEALRDSRAKPSTEITARFVKAHQALTGENPLTAQILNSALNRNPGLAKQIHAPGGMDKIVSAMRIESAALKDPEVRAQRFIEAWKGLQSQHDKLFRFADREARTATEGRMRGIVEELAKDPAAQAALGRRRRELGMPVSAERGITHQLTRSIGLSRGLER